MMLPGSSRTITKIVTEINNNVTNIVGVRFIMKACMVAVYESGWARHPVGPAASVDQDQVLM
jgi:hypothetical protein